MKRIYSVLLCLLLAVIVTAKDTKPTHFPFFTQSSKQTVAPLQHKKQVTNQLLIPVSKVVAVAQAGTLNALLTSSEKATITNLTITGNIDARDFKIMRDNMPWLALLDISGVTIKAYTGYGGTDYDSYLNPYPANEIPEFSFFVQSENEGLGNNTLTTVVLPSSASSIGSLAFGMCTSMTSISIATSVIQIGINAFAGCSALIQVDAANPVYSSHNGVLYNKAKTTLIQCPVSLMDSYDIASTVDSIGNYAFVFCNKLSTVTIPASLKSIGIYAFTSCSAAINVDSNNLVYSSLEGVLFDKLKSLLIQCTTSKTGSYTIPSTVETIGENSFYGCSKLTAISIPSSVVSIRDLAFMNCSGLSAITVNSFPISLDSNNDVFYNVHLTTCVLNVPYRSKAAYQSATVWNSFLNIVENPHGFMLDKDELFLSLVTENKGVVGILSSDSWTVNSNQPWLTVNPSSGAGDGTFTCTAKPNTYPDNRVAIVTITSALSEVQPQTILITQLGLPKEVTIVAGELATSFTASEYNSIYNLKITGTLDARDFRFLRDSLTMLSYLDISDVSIVAYSGLLGPSSWITTYSANTIPENAFNEGFTSQRIALLSVVLPTNITSIGASAFYSCGLLSEIKIPTSVSSIGSYAFANCRSLTSIVLPNSLNSISYATFDNCSALIDLTIGNSVTSIGDAAFRACSSLTSIVIPNSVITMDGSTFARCTNLRAVTLPNSINKITNYCFYECSSLTDIIIPASVTKIEDGAFESCIGMTSLNIPVTVTAIGNEAFSNCTGLNSITVHWDIPLDLSTVRNVFYNVDVANCVLNVPFGVKAIYTSAYQWKDFVNIVENTHGLKLSNYAVKLSVEEGSNATVAITATQLWTATSNQPWLKVTPNSGVTNDNIILNAEKNISTIPRTAVVTVISGALSKVITVIQSASPKVIAITAGGLATALTASELSAITNLSISGTMDARDFKTMRDNMPVLESVDISAVDIEAYTGNDGTYGNTYLANQVPQNSFFNSNSYTGKQTLLFIKLPASTKSIGNNAFNACTGLLNITLPCHVTSIGRSSFQGCTELGVINFPTSLVEIGESAFNQCSSLASLILPDYVTSIGSSAFSSCTGLKNVTLGNTLISIENGTFYNCSRLLSVSIPASVNAYKDNAFMNCSALVSITTEAISPVDLTSNSYVFDGVDKTKCVLNVPYQSKSLYASTSQWQDFLTIIENPIGLLIDFNAVRLDTKSGSSAVINVISNVEWNAASNEAWLTVAPAQGTGNKQMTLSATENTSNAPRTAIVTIAAVGLREIKITVTQTAAAKTVNVTAGGLMASLTPTELTTISNLIITGVIDARDFKTMRDAMPLLVDIDVSATTIAAYTGTEGTFGTFNFEYPAAILPQSAFSGYPSGLPKKNLISFILPTSVTSIGANAFQNCSQLISVQLPNSLNSIGNYAFSSCKGLTDLDFGTSVSSINNQAFENCISLKRVILPNSVKTLGNQVFAYCTGLTDVVLGNLMTTTGTNTFKNCRALTNVVLPNSVTTIGIMAFSSCSNLSNINLSNSITTIGNNAFSNCNKLSSVVIPNSVNTIEYSAFSNCTGLKNIRLSNSLKTIANGTFGSCTGLTDIIIPNAVTTIEDGAFSSCSSLKSIKFGSSLETISAGAFSNCYVLDDVIIPSSVNTIEMYAFNGCSGMKSITIPASISTLGYSSISCSGLTAIYSLAERPYAPYETSVFNYVNKSTCILYVPKGSKAVYQSTTQWKDFVNISEEFDFMLETETVHIKSGGSYTLEFPTNNIVTAEPNQPWLSASVVSKLGKYIVMLTSDRNPNLSLRMALLKVTVANGPTRTYTVIQSGSPKIVNATAGELRNYLTADELRTVSALTILGTIDARDFRVMRDSMPQLADIDLKDVSIAAYSGFEGTAQFDYSYIYLSNRIPKNAFYVTYSGIGKETLASIILPINTNYIEQSSFAYASGLTSVTIPDQVKVIGETAFGACKGLKEVIIGNSVTTIGTRAFYICPKLQNITIPNSVTTISEEAFSNCSGLVSVTFPSNLTTIGTDAFVFCSSIKTIELPNSLTKLGAGAFRYCERLANVILPASLIELSKDAFYFCPSLKEIKLPETLQTIGYEAFGYCTGLSSISIPASVTTISQFAFDNCNSLATIYAYPTVAPLGTNNTSLSSNVFTNVNKTTCRLYVPQGSKSHYQEAMEWKDFLNIFEMNTGLSDENANAIRIYPNPIKDHLWIKGLTETVDLSIIDFLGKVVLYRKLNVDVTVEVSDLPKGIYVVRIGTKEGTIDKKMLKE